MGTESKNKNSTDKNLTEKEKAFLLRVARRGNLWLLFSILSVTAAVFVVVYHGVIRKDFTPMVFLVMLLLLLSGRAQMRIWKCARIFDKVKSLAVQTEP
ncbi:MAG: hypothetical protein M0Z58_09275 [Nitrospiraceae bacterium]|nr:hypothetical protein [Nitrospiraceae bacterium]